MAKQIQLSKPVKKTARKSVLAAKAKVKQQRSVILCKKCGKEILQGRCCITEVGKDNHYHLECHVPHLPSEHCERNCRVSFH
jgi:hypothetical protein